MLSSWARGPVYKGLNSEIVALDKQMRVDKVNSSKGGQSDRTQILVGQP